MNVKVLYGVAASCLSAVMVGQSAAQKPIETPQAVGSYEQALKDLLTNDAPDKLWMKLDTTGQQQLLKEIKDSQLRILMLPVGPVAPLPIQPRPSPTSPKPRPVNPKPTMQEFEHALNDLHQALERTSKTSPQTSLPSTEARELQLLIQKLTKGGGE